MAGSYGRGRLQPFFPHNYFAYLPDIVFLFPPGQPLNLKEMTAKLPGKRSDAI